MVTHDAGAAAAADRVVVLRDGGVVHDGVAEKAEDLLDLMKQVA
jgi:putative ABC transport system ATP-binding protein